MRLGIDASNIRAGGGVTHLVELLRTARPQAVGIRQVTVWGGGATLNKIEPRPWLQIIHDPFLDRSLPIRQYWQRFKLPRLAAKHCDVLFVPGGSYLGTFHPFVTMSQNMLPFEPNESRRYGISWMRLKFHLLNISQSQSFHRSEGVIFTTEYARRTVFDQIGEIHGHQVVIPHGIGKELYLAPRPQRSINNYSFQKPFRLLYVSIIDMYKHQWNVAEAVARLRKKGMPIELELIGPAYSPALRRFLKTTRQLDPAGQFIHYRGNVPYQSLTDYYHQADMFIFASSCENMPIILLEAMAAGLPIACSNRGPMPEILGSFGEYFDPEQPDQIEQALRTLLGNCSRRQECAQGAYARSREHSWERCARDTLAFLVEIAL